MAGKTAVVYHDHDPLGGETVATRENGDREIRIPTWVVTFIKISIPVLLVAIPSVVAGYYHLQQMDGRVQAIEREKVPLITSNRTKINTLDGAFREMDLRREMQGKNITRTLDTIQKQVEKMSFKVEKMSVVQQTMQTDISLIQQKIKKDP